MKITKIICDKCKKEFGEGDTQGLGLSGLHLTLTKGKEMDASGNSYIPQLESMDVCERCIEEMLSDYLYQFKP